MTQETIICQMHSLYKIWVSYSSVFLLLPVHTRFCQFVHPNPCPLSGRDRAVSWQHRRFVLAQGVHCNIVSMCIKSIILRMCNYYPALWFPPLHRYSIRHRSHEKDASCSRRSATKGCINRVKVHCKHVKMCEKQTYTGPGVSGVHLIRTPTSDIGAWRGWGWEKMANLSFWWDKDVHCFPHWTASWQTASVCPQCLILLIPRNLECDWCYLLFSSMYAYK